MDLADPPVNGQKTTDDRRNYIQQTVPMDAFPLQRSGSSPIHAIGIG